MKLSMHMLAWYLQDYRPICAIKNDAAAIEGIRFLSEESQEILPQYAYAGKASYFFTDYRSSEDYLVVHKSSFFRFQGCDHEALLNALLSAFDFFNHWEQELSDAVLGGADLRALLLIAERVISNPMEVVILNRSHIATGNLTDPSDEYWNAGIQHQIEHPAVFISDFYDAVTGEKIEDLTEMPRLVKNVYPPGAPVLMLYLKENNEFVGFLGILQYHSQWTPLNMQLAPFLIPYLSHAREFTEPSGSARSYVSMIQDLLSGRPIGEENQRLLSEKLPSSTWRLLLYQHLSRNDTLEKQVLLKRLTRSSETLFQWNDGKYIGAIMEESVFLKQDSFSTYRNSFAIGASMPTLGDAANLPVCYEQALFALDSSQKQAGIFRCEDYAFEYMLNLLRSHKYTSALYHPALKLLEQYDRTHHTELRQSLHAYLQNGSSLLAASKCLHIHTNTMRYRLTRIRELTGLLLNETEDNRYLLLSDWLEA